jgi:hypothetical protein
MQSIKQTRVLALLFAVAILGASSSALAQQVRLSARRNKVINGVEAQLRGDYRARNAPVRLNAELEDINIPLGTKVAFCLVQNGVATRIGVGRVVRVAGIPTASVELAVADGDFVPTVDPGDVLQARQRRLAPFQANPTCGTALLVAAPFQ